MKTHIDADYLLKLKKEMPHGGMTEVANSTGYSLTYVSQIFSGRVMVNDDNYKVILTAMKVIREHREKVMTIENAIRDITTHE